MRERPILFTAPNVGLILRDEKTQTRRVVRYPRYGNYQSTEADWNISVVDEGLYLTSRDGIIFDTPSGRPSRGMQDHVLTCPYGVVGDRLWVKEAWRIGAWNQDTGELWLDYRADGHCRRDSLTIPDDDHGANFNALWQGSCDELEALGITPDSDGQYRWPKGESPLRWRSPRFMPRYAARLFLEVAQVRVQRLQDITEEDAVAEGVENVAAYRKLWDAINAKRAPWESNPFVWALTFRRVK